ncbi:NB-ARC domain-containing protein [Mycena indigotica]|uniref:NB-ARC domain-containing protein n=1 Tax=Mycena indigotica TaxID=2126181 RepID=A0A8H6S2C7_9AGAR|nr:NB-ARC domain-containing protein [Mycena indigotica]KAF7291403.1 NB-ARC domain-containing protein [Mycena indigotica]
MPAPDALKRVLQYTTSAAETLRATSNGVGGGLPFVGSVCSIVLALVPVIQNVKAQRQRSLQITERIHQLLCVLLAASTAPSLRLGSMKTLVNMGRCTRVLQQFHACLQAQQARGRIQRLLRNTEIVRQLDSCERELNAVIEALKLEMSGALADEVGILLDDVELRQHELLELLASRSESAALESGTFLDSALSLSLLPASPQIFHGRDTELASLVSLLQPLSDAPAPRIAILGPGGMGKTALALTLLHHPAIASEYSNPNQRHFVSCEALSTAQDLVRAVAQHVGVEAPAAQNSVKVLMAKLKEGERCIIVLDNLETVWDSDSAGETDNVEDFLAQLAEVEHVGLVVTMRGAERPGKIKWTRPFLPVLEPLTAEATRELFMDIAEAPDLEVDNTALDELLLLSDNLPLAASLLASAASIEGYAATLTRWRRRGNNSNTVFSEAEDHRHKNASLDISIHLSLSSPRMRSAPYACDLLSTLSLLPDGISAEELYATGIHIVDLGHHVTTLLRLSLIYIETVPSAGGNYSSQRIKTLAPIREYIRRTHPPPRLLTDPLLGYFQNLLAISNFYSDLADGGLIPRIASHFANIRELMLYGLSVARPEQLSAIGNAILDLNYMSFVMLKGPTPLLERLPGIVEDTNDLRIRLRHSCQYIVARAGAVDNVKAKTLIGESLGYIKTVHFPVDQILMLYNAITAYYMPRDLPQSIRYNALASELVERTLDSKQNILVLDSKYHLLIHDHDGQGILELVERERAFGRTDVVCTLKAINGHRMLGHLGRVIELCAQAREEIARSGLDKSDRALAILDFNGDAHLGRTEFAEAEVYYTELLRRTDLLTSAGWHVHAQCMLALIGIRTGKEEVDIARYLDQAEKVYRTRGSSRVVQALWLRAELDLHIRHDLSAARAGLLATARKSLGMYTDILLPCLAALGDVRLGLFNDETEAFRWALVYLVTARKTRDQVALLYGLRCLADVLPSSAQETSQTLLRTAMDGAKGIGIRRLETDCVKRLTVDE